MENLELALDKIETLINWDNWKTEDGEYWNVPEVLYCKLDHLLNENEKLEAEFIETITQVQEIMQALAKDMKGE